MSNRLIANMRIFNMHRALWSLGAIVLALLVFPACAGPTQISVSLGQSVNLALGHEVVITGEPLRIRFAEVLDDSRCPTGATCIWQGQVSARLDITYQNTKTSMVVTQPGLTTDLSMADFNDYQFQFQVQPYPDVGKQIGKNEYRLQLIVDKRPSLSGGVLVTFDVVGEEYSTFIANKETIEQVYAVQRGESQARIPSGKLLKGSVPYNEPWSWHVDSDDIQMVEVAIELCDGTPSQVEANLDYWVNTVQRFCPWSATIQDIVDFR
jgi:hypothetical protein